MISTTFFVHETPAKVVQLSGAIDLPTLPLVGESITIEAVHYVVRGRAFQMVEQVPQFRAALFLQRRDQVAAAPTATEQARAMGLKL